MQALQILVSGVVQQVGYRAWTMRTARELGVNGWCRNLDDGRVEIFAEGEESALNALAKKCERGPTYAEVSAVKVEPRTPRGLKSFVMMQDAEKPESA
jgi:acylphosphatase